jgi:hypothetical protein
MLGNVEGRQLGNSRRRSENSVKMNSVKVRRGGEGRLAPEMGSSGEGFVF